VHATLRNKQKNYHFECFSCSDSFWSRQKVRQTTTTEKGQVPPLPPHPLYIQWNHVVLLCVCVACVDIIKPKIKCTIFNQRYFPQSRGRGQDHHVDTETKRMAFDVGRSCWLGAHSSV
jgi:hypothetical protein